MVTPCFTAGGRQDARSRMEGLSSASSRQEALITVSAQTEEKSSRPHDSIKGNDWWGYRDCTALPFPVTP
jgi:hypothetical protein